MPFAAQMDWRDKQFYAEFDSALPDCRQLESFACDIALACFLEVGKTFSKGIAESFGDHQRVQLFSGCLTDGISEHPFRG